MFKEKNTEISKCRGDPDPRDPRVRKMARFSISLNLELLFCEIFDCKERVFLVCLNSIYTAACAYKRNFLPA